jgi:CHAT domain-containing protein
MKKYLILILIFSSLLFTFPANAFLKDIFNAHDWGSAGKKIPAFSEAQELNRKYINDPKLSIDQKIKLIIEILTIVGPYLSESDFQVLIQEAEPIILTNSKDADIAISQGVFFVSLLNKVSRENPTVGYFWPFSVSKDIIFLKLEQLSELEKCGFGALGCEKLKNIPFVKAFLALIVAPTYINYGKYDQAKIAIDDMIAGFNTRPDKLLSAREIEEWPNLQKAYLYLAYGMKYRLAEATGTFDLGIKESEYISDNFYSLMEYMSKNETSMRINYGDYRWVYEIDQHIGRHEQVLTKAKYLLSKMKIDNKNLQITTGRALIMKDISDEYHKLGLFELAEKYRDASMELDELTGAIDTEILGFKIYNEIGKENFSLANKYINSFDLKICAKYENKTFDREWCDSFTSSQRELIGQLTKAKTEVAKKDAEMKHWKKNAESYEQFILTAHSNDAGYKDDLILLKDYSFLYDAYRWAGEEVFSALYGKKYINQLQKLRSQLTNKNIETFTSLHADQLKEISKTFYKVNDFYAAWACLNIIKENEFLDYVRRRGVEENFLTKIELNKPEAEFSLKHDMLINEIRLLKNSSINQQALLDAIKEKQSELEKLKKAFLNNSLNFARQEIKNNKNLNTSLSLKSNEAAIQYLLTENDLTIFLSTNKENKKFELEINRNLLRQEILELQRILATKAKIDSARTLKLSDILIKAPLDFLQGKKIDKLKIKTDDLLSLIPLNTLEYRGTNLGQFYTVQKIGFNNNKLVSASNNTNFDAFGATKGSSQYNFKPLTGVKKEIDFLINLQTNERVGHKSAFVDEKFTATNFKNSFDSNTSYIHVATHFKLDGNLASSSKMLLGDGSIMTLEQVREIIPESKTELLTLSACNTGDVISSSNKSYEGLASIFQLKGSKNVISTLWEIDDQATSDFMGIFYNILLNNSLEPAVALNYTQEIFRTGKVSSIPNKIVLNYDDNIKKAIANITTYSHPFYWAAFQISSAK